MEQCNLDSICYSTLMKKILGTEREGIILYYITVQETNRRLTSQGLSLL
jgi:hypothetical protein